MPANEFEKQVQQRMDEFQLNPSASVWKRVEEELRTKRKRRVIFFILLPALVALLGFSVYYFLDNERKVTLAGELIEKKEASADKINPSVTTKNQTNSSLTGATQQVETGKEDQADPEKTIRGNNKLDISFPVSQTRRLNIKQPARRTQMTEITTMSSAADKNVPANDESNHDNNLPVLIAPPSTGIVTKPATEPAAMNTKSNKQKDSLATVSKDTAATKPDSLATDIVKRTSGKKAKKTSKVKWGIDFFAGVSFVQTGMFAWEGTQFGAMSYSYGGNPATSPGGSVNPRSDVKPGFSFSIGVSGEWKISDRSSFSTGLLYHYASNRIKVGSAMDTTLQNPSNFNSFQRYTIYHGAPTEDHTNSYHFISLPLEYHHLLSRKIQLQWDLGVAINYLLATNALIYTQSYGGIYYEDKDAFFKTHCTARTGFSFRLKSKNGMEWVTGPVISLDMTRLLKNDQNKEYLLFTGLNTKIYFPKKKDK